jgi:arachidonate 15-lipoxygenase
MEFTNIRDCQALSQFQAELAAIETTIQARNSHRRAEYGIDYPYLLPSRIPNSINI